MKELIHHYGAWIVFLLVFLELIGLPLAGEAILVSAAIFAGTTHNLNIGLVTANQNLEAMMNEEVFNVSIRKFLKTLGVSAQREIEKAVRQALAEGKLQGNERLPARAVVTLGGIGLSHEINGEIELEQA